MAERLDLAGLSYLWGKLKAHFASKDTATTSAAGLMSSTDKAKLDGIASGAQVNSITGVKGDAESTYRNGNVNLTPANIGAVDKSGDTMTGSLTASGYTINGSWPTFYMKTLVDNSYINDVVIQASPSGKLAFITYINGVRREIYSLPAPTSSTEVNYDVLTTKTPVGISQGGTGVTTAAVVITNNYSSVLNVINAVKGMLFPISIQKNGSASYSDMPSGTATNEWNMLLFGGGIRITALLNIYQTSKMFIRHFYSDHWATEWVQLHQ